MVYKEAPSVCNACVVTYLRSGQFADVRQGLEMAENVAEAADYAAPANMYETRRTVGQRVRILSPRPNFLKSHRLQSIACRHGRRKSRLRV